MKCFMLYIVISVVDVTKKAMRKSAQTQPEISMEKELDLLLQITENVWVQCDNPNCQKWRKVPKEAAVSYGPGVPWYCSLNQDSNANDCSKPEENHAEYEKMAVKAGVKFVLSELEMGELVWAKTAGYCRWPGVVTRDPESGLHVSLDVDGDPVAYHIEYLGNPHTHCWVYAHLTETYGHKCKTMTESLKREVLSIVEGKMKNRKIEKEKMKGINKQFRIKDAIEEAEYLLKLSKSARLRLMMFEHNPGESLYIAAQPAGKEDSCPGSTRKMLHKKKKSKRGSESGSKKLSEVNYSKKLCMANRETSVTDLSNSENITIEERKPTTVNVNNCQHHLLLTDDSLCVTKQFDTMMTEIEQDIQSLSPLLSQDSGKEDANFELDDIEFDLSAMEGYFGQF